MVGKKVKGRKRHIATDTRGNLLSIKVHAANIHDTNSGSAVLAFRLIRYVFISTYMSCHGKNVTDYIKELSTLKSTSKKYEYMLSRGYKLAGFLPNCYGVNEHGIMVVKNLCE